MDAISALLFVGLIYFVYLAGRIAERRGRSFKTWSWIAAGLIGPLAIPLLFLLPNLNAGGPKGPNGENGSAVPTGAVRATIQGNPDPRLLNTSFA